MDPSELQDAQESPSRPVVSIRALLIVLFAIVLLATAGVTKGASPEKASVDNGVIAHGSASTTIQYDGITKVVRAANHTAETRAAIDARQNAIDAVTASRPKYTEMVVSLANFDADADPDGWRVELVLRDKHDRPVIARANATFELMPRVPTADHFNYVDAATMPVRWSMNLTFGDDGVARIKLPLRDSLRPLFG